MKILKLTIVILLTFGTGVSISSCGNSSTKANTGQTAATEIPNGEKIYLKYCKLCHGVDGNLQLNGAADLQKSALNKEDMIKVITIGRNTMQPYKELLNEGEIKAVAEYVMKFRDK